MSMKVRAIAIARPSINVHAVVALAVASLSLCYAFFTFA